MTSHDVFRKRAKLKGGPGYEVNPRPQALHFNFALVGPGSRNFNGTHDSGCLHGDAFFYHDTIPECPWPSE